MDTSLKGHFTHRWVAVSLVIVTGLFFGYYAWFIWFANPPASYPVKWGQARWLHASDAAARCAYFRKTFALPPGIENASLQVMATDSVLVYVNGYRVDERNAIGCKTFGIVDITPYLGSGENTLAILVEKPQFSGRPMMAARLEYVERSGLNSCIESDASWKTETLPQAQGSEPAGTIHWYDTRYIDDAWPRAITANSPSRSDIQYCAMTVVAGGKRREAAYSYPPELFSLRPKGHWLGPPLKLSRNLYFRKTLLKPDAAERHGRAGVWLRLSAVGIYSLIVNGVVVADEVKTNHFDIRDITDFLRDGNNVIAVNLFEPNMRGKIFCDIMLFDQDKQLLHLPSDSSWNISTTAPGDWLSPHYDDSNWMTVAELSAISLEMNRNRVKDIEAVGPGLIYLLAKRAKMLMFLLVTTGGLFILLRACARIMSGMTGIETDKVRFSLSLAHWPVLAYFSLSSLMQYDIRIPPDWFFRPSIFLLPALLLGLLYFWVGFNLKRPHIAAAGAAQVCFRQWLYRRRRAFIAASCIGLMSIAVYLRAKDTMRSSFWHDELGTITFARGILEHGLPSSTIVADVVKFKVMNFLIPYAVLPFMKLFGENEFGARFSSILFGLCTAAIIYLFGARLFGRTAGVLAALVYIFSPWAIYWCKAKYPQQSQFFSVLSVYFFYRFIEIKDRLDPKFLYAALVSFLLAFYSWQGCAFLLFGYFLLMLFEKKERWWMNPHMIVFAGVVIYAAFMAIQLAVYSFYQMPMMHQGLAARIESATTGRKQLLASWFEPLWYVRSLLFMEHHQLLGALSLFSIPPAFRSARFRFVSVMLFAPLLAITYINPRHATHYLYFLQPILLITGVAVFLAALDRILELCEASSFLKEPALISRAAVTAALVLACSPFILHLYKLPAAEVPYMKWDSSRGEFLDVPYSDDVGAMSRKVASSIQPGDIVIGIGVSPLVLEHYFGKADFLMGGGMPGAESAAYWAPTGQYIFYEVRGVPILLSSVEFKEKVHDHPRVWVLATKAILNGEPELDDWARNHLDLFFETYTTCLFAKIS